MELVFLSLSGSPDIVVELVCHNPKLGETRSTRDLPCLVAAITAF
jgi:hypothetical protein